MTPEYYGVIAYDNPNGFSYQRLWESPTHEDRASASAAVFDELATGNYNGIVGVSWVIIETGDN